MSLARLALFRGAVVAAAASIAFATRPAGAEPGAPSAGASSGARGAGPTSAGADRELHLRLVRSEPAKDEELTASPGILRLWFSLPPEMAITSVRLAGAGGQLIALGAPRRGKGAKDPVEVEVERPLVAGAYTVSWKTASRDGHPITGEFGFSVKALAR